MALPSRNSYLDVSSNQLSGSIPTAISAMSALQYLSVASNALSGTVPLDLSSLSALRYDEAVVVFTSVKLLFTFSRMGESFLATHPPH